VNVLVIAGPIVTISLHGEDFEVIWMSPDHRQFDSSQQHLELISFKCLADKDSAVLAESLPKAIDKCWIRNEVWQPGPIELERAVEKWQDEHRNDDQPLDDLPLPLESEVLLPAELQGLPMEPETSETAIASMIQKHAKELNPEDVSANFCHSFSVREACRLILEEQLGPIRGFTYQRSSPGIIALRATFENGSILFFKDLREREMQTTPLPDYFTSFEGAAQYAGVSSRTIKNWKNRNWLKVEQEGRKIRIARSELDKCIRKQ
jgi:hypothetical protein